ncbi:hypothetical protein CCHL11_02254 [Colletotrichum chlorophyti]|uniref:DUF7707 domain-containing protein n=1 Tax=Colletotrichum chlorophyti TaxID=708187 RepID=A0A1Q8S6I5_9PEZI|nr:hypothetical protein CCHL11_02254 [Colletotrichum chlorophyti]
MRTSFALLALSAAASVSAQRKIYVASDLQNPGAIDISLRSAWCTGERNTCGALCDRATTNDCDVTTLEYSCICSNGTAPGLEYYDQSMPSFICMQAFSECNTANVGNRDGQENCTTSIKDQCGTLNATEVHATSAAATTTTAAPTGTGTGSANTAATTAPSSSSSSAFAAPTANPARYGNAAAIAAIGLFAYLL